MNQRTAEIATSWQLEAGAELIPGYRLIEPLGSGGFGEVWKCSAPGGILKAIKIVAGDDAMDGGGADKADQEKAALEKVKLIRHPFILPMDLITVINKHLLIVMELADKSLHDSFEEYRKEGRSGIPRDLLLGFLSDAADGLDHMNEKHGLQHLDVKPRNLFLLSDRVKVADFGLVRGLERPASGGGMGGITPVYAAPEVFSNKVSKRSDQYSLGIVYSELLTGSRVFHGKNIRQLAMQHMTETPDLGLLPACDQAIVAKALAKNPEDRYPTCSAFIKAMLGRGGNNPAITISLPTASPSRKTPIANTPPPSRSTVGGTGLSLVTQKTRGKSNDTPARPRVSSTMPATAQSPFATGSSLETNSGVLRPAIFIGIGSFGRRALQQLRCRLTDRVGQLSQMPCFRFIYLDPDPAAVDKALNASPDMALHTDQVFIAPLQPPANYRRKQLDHLLDWMPRETLNALAKNPKVDGSRCLGRLAFTDNYMRFSTRLRQEITTCTHPDMVTQSANHSGLNKRSNIPTVYIFASASGGTSGMLMDVGYAVKRALEKANLTNATVSAFVMTGAPHDPGTSAEEHANTFATLTELNHYADQDVTFSANYGGSEGPVIEGHGLPFNATYLLPMAKRTRDALHDCVAHLAGYVAYDVTTSLGAGLDRARNLPPTRDRSPFRGFGTFGVWYPRGLLLRSAARQVCIDLFRNWSSSATTLSGSAEQILSGILAESRLTPQPLKDFIVKESVTKTDGHPLERLDNWWQLVNTQSELMIKNGVIGEWATGVWDQAREWLGTEPTSHQDSTYRRGRLSKSLDVGFKRAVEAWDQELAARFHSLDTLPGQRLGVAEFVLDQLLQSAAGAIATLEGQVAGYAARREGTKLACQDALEICHTTGGSFSLFGNRFAKNVRNFLARVKDFVELRREEDLAMCTLQFYKRLHQRFDDRKIGYKGARERISRLAELMEAPMLLGTGSGYNHPSIDDAAAQSTLQGTNTMRVVLPHGEDNLDRSASNLIEGLSKDALLQLETSLTKTILTPRGGLTAMSGTGADLVQHLANPLMDQASLFLAKHLPSEDVTAVEFSAARGSQDEMNLRMSSYIRGAEPLTGGPLDNEKTYLLHPDSEAGYSYATSVRQMVPAVIPMPIQGTSTDLLFCREQSGLRSPDLCQLLEPCWEAYQQSLQDVQTNPHSRHDVNQWLPLVE